MQPTYEYIHYLGININNPIIKNIFKASLNLYYILSNILEENQLRCTKKIQEINITQKYSGFFQGKKIEI